MQKVTVAKPICLSNTWNPSNLFMSLHHGLTDLCNSVIDLLYCLLYILPWFQATYQASLRFCPPAKLTIKRNLSNCHSAKLGFHPRAPETAILLCLQVDGIPYTSEGSFFTAHRSIVPRTHSCFKLNGHKPPATDKSVCMKRKNYLPTSVASIAEYNRRIGIADTVRVAREILPRLSLRL